MENFAYIIWNVSPEIISSPITIRWYGLLFASGFLFGQFIMSKFFTKEGKSKSDLEKLTIYIVIATIVGARLGHCFFYDAKYFLAHPIEILYVWKGGLASHGAAIALIITVFLYTRKHKTLTFWWVIDRLVILVALAGALIRTGNLMNSEIIGKPTNISIGLIHTHTLYASLNKDETDVIKKIRTYQENKDTTVKGQNYPVIRLEILLDRKEIKKENINNFITASILNRIKNLTNYSRDVPLHYKLFKVPKIKTSEEDRDYLVTLKVHGVPRHAAQFYEGLSTFLLFWLLLFLYYRTNAKDKPGLFFAIFMIVVFTLRFLYEFIKENQEAFEDSLSLNMGQILSIPAVLIGIIALFIVFRNDQKHKKIKSERK